ncbi:hypothetical protein [Maridesulfovibrio frigidus]|nr:hypothetical protein [Maridesulfovibrio frigidus]
MIILQGTYAIKTENAEDIRYHMEDSDTDAIVIGFAKNLRRSSTCKL